MTVTVPSRPSSLAAKQVCHLKRPPSPSCVLVAHMPAKMKRPRNLAYPPADPQIQTQAGKSAGGSKQAVAKRKANEHVLNGTFVHNLKRWDEYKRNLQSLIPTLRFLKTQDSRDE
jgi:hypothetical protein